MFAENIHGKMRNNNKKNAKRENSMNILNNFYRKKIPPLVLFIVRYFMNYSNISLLQKYIKYIHETLVNMAKN
jgi:hypothetical protein